MPKLSELTDAYTPQETIDSLPVESPFVSVPADPDGVRRVRIDTVAPKQEAAEPGIFSQNADKFINALFRDDDKRYQLWPERMVREGLSAAGDVMSGKVPQWAVDPESGDVHTSPNMVEKAQEMSALAGTGGLAGMTTDATLGATPFLRPALKYKDKLYKGKDGQQHMDVIPASIYPEFQRQAMSGEDISNFQFGFVNEKGHFLDREKALKHAIDTGLVDPQAAQYGALTAPVLERMQNNGSMSVYPDKGFSGGGLNGILTTQLLADSSKPGIAIEAMKKVKTGNESVYSQPTHPEHELWKNSVPALINSKTGEIAKGKRGQVHNEIKEPFDDTNPDYSSNWKPGFYDIKEKKFVSGRETEMNSTDLMTNYQHTKHGLVSDTALPSGYQLVPVDHDPFKDETK